MTHISVTDFVNWKSDPVTQVVMQTILDKVSDAKDTLAFSAGMDSTQDNFMRGYIRALLDVTEISFVDVTE